MSKEATKKVLYSFNDLDLTAAAEQGYTFEYVSEAGIGLGITLTVLGANSPKVKDWIVKELNKSRLKDAMRASHGKKPEVSKIEEDVEYGIHSAAIRVIAWDGIDADCTFENVCKLMSINGEILKQVMDASNELGNFTKNK